MTLLTYDWTFEICHIIEILSLCHIYVWMSASHKALQTNALARSDTVCELAYNHR